MGCRIGASTVTYATIRVPMTFPVSNRKVYVTPVADMSAKKKDDSYPRMSSALRTMILKHADERILIHTVSYDLTQYLTKDLIARLGPHHKRVMTYKGAQERDRVIERYRKQEGAVLLAPSLDRGVDFKGDDCRVVAVAKVPFPYLGDKQVSARLHSPGGSLWYSVQTVRSLVQMTGRGVRSAEDFCTSYILDTQFVSNVWKRSKALLPQWWVDALDLSAQFVPEFTRG